MSSPLQDAPEPIHAVTEPSHIRSRLALLFIVLCTLLAAGLRTHAATRSGLWGDECLFLAVVQSPTVPALLQFLHFHESHPPLFYLMMRGWIALFGGSDLSVLVPPVLFSIATVPVAYVIGIRVFGRRTGLIAALLTAVSPTLTEYGVLVRPYSWLPLLCLGSVYYLWRLLSAPSRERRPMELRRDAAIYAALLLLLIYSHNWGVVVLAGHWLGVSLLALRDATFRRRLCPWLSAQAAVLALYAPWLSAAAYQGAHAGHVPVAYELVLRKIYYRIGLHGLADHGGTAQLWTPIAALAAVGVGIAIAAARRRPMEAAAATKQRSLAYWCFAGIPLLTLLVAAVLSARSDLMKLRCLVILLPCALLLVADVLARLLNLYSTSRTNSLPARIAGGFLALALAAQAVVGQRALSRTIKSNARELGMAVAARTQSADRVLIAPEWMAQSFNRYYPPRNEQIDFPHEGREGGMDYADVAARTADPETYLRVRAWLTAARHEQRRVWFITGADFSPPNSALSPDTRIEMGSDWMGIGNLRAAQLYLVLRQLYGEPTTGGILPDKRNGTEIRAFLFAPEPDTVPVTRQERSGAQANG